jgi:hypothetical protein
MFQKILYGLFGINFISALYFTLRGMIEKNYEISEMGFGLFVLFLVEIILLFVTEIRGTRKIN